MDNSRELVRENNAQFLRVVKRRSVGETYESKT